VVVETTAGDDGAVVDPATVWRVELRSHDIHDREGVLTLTDSALVFTDRATGSQTLVAFSEIRSVRRVRASPILMVTHADGGDTAFYFSQPPPLERAVTGSVGTTATGRPLGPFGGMRRTSKRRHQRENVKYLTTKAASLKPAIQAWVDEISARRR